MSDFATAVKAAPSGTVSSQPGPHFDECIAYGIMRLTTGINIALHGISRQVAGQAAFLAYLNHYFEKTPLIPKESLPVFAFTIMWAETIFGILMVVGAFTRVALIGG